MPMRIVASLTAAPTPIWLFGCWCCGGAGRDEVLHRLPTAVRFLLVNGQVGSRAVDRLAGRLVGHRHRIMTAAVGKIARRGDLYLIGREVELQVRVCEQALQRLPAI